MRILAWLALFCAFALTAWPLAKKKKEEQTQTLRLPKDPPAAVVVDTRNLVFHVSPISAKGLLSAQVRDALKAITRQEGNVVKIRAFVAGRGDQRRVRDVIAETFTDRKQNLPAVTVVQAGALSLEGAQVVLESIGSARKPVNEHGLAFLAAQEATGSGPLDPVAPLAAKVLENLKAAAVKAGSDSADVLSVTCYVSSLEGLAQTRGAFAAEFPKAAFNWVQSQRAAARSAASCEAVARLNQDPGGPLVIRDGLALIGAPKLVLTGTQMSFGVQDSDAKLAFERLGRALEQAGSSLSKVAFADYYSLSPSVSEQIRRVETQIFDPKRLPANTLIPLEGLPSMDASFAMDVAAIHE